ncbi:OsmC family protein [Azospirillum soli]|uniref:OsmC family protein n=1 Tax=Azospirillum soli TaxID=1304799 RepID=UPI001FE6B207|nr:OsmC family protein [Azospirillum soli]MBP2314562.1 putative OsmC-like protein [Azospirillum soli]
MSTTATMTATMTKDTATKKNPPMPLNGVDTPKLFATIGVVAGQPELAKFQFRAQSRWVSGTHSRSTMHGFSGAGGDHTHSAPFKADADHPAVLCGGDNGPTPVEYVLHALASCLTAGIANIAAARGVTLDEVESTVEGDIDLRGILGLSNTVRNGFQSIRISFRVKGDAPEAKLREIVEQSRARSAVYDILTNGVPVAIAMND